MQIENSTAQAYQPPANGFRTFLIVWITQSVSVFGSALTFFALTIWLTQVLYPNPDQKPLLAGALAALMSKTGQIGAVCGSDALPAMSRCRQRR